MVDVNSTVFVQVINFLIAWWVLSKFLFKPVVEVILKERKEKQALQTGLAKQKKVLEGIQQQQKEEWKGYLARFKKHLPLLQDQVVVSAESICKKPIQDASGNNASVMINQATEYLVKRVISD